jgi:ATP-dependent Clp protease ATP-binding subunit ClpA
MIRTTVLDPNRTGKDATHLEIGLRRQVVGQDEAIEQIARVYQMDRRGISL